MKRADEAAKWLAGSFTIVTAALTGLGAVNGGLERMLRNHSVQAQLAFCLVVLGIGFAIVAYMLIFSEKNIWKEQILLGIGGVFFSAGLIWAVAIAASTPSIREHARITVSFPQPCATTDKSSSCLARSAQISVKAQGIQGEDAIAVDVVSLVREEEGFRAVSRLYQSTAGPDATGAVDLTFSVAVPQGTRYLGISAGDVGTGSGNCDPQKAHVGCTIVFVPPFTELPSLGVSWSETAERMLSIVVGTDGLPLDRGLVLYVKGIGKNGSSSTLYRALLAPTAGGMIDTTIHIPVPESVRRVCVAAMTEIPDTEHRTLPPPGCGLKAGTSTVWVIARAPRKASATATGSV